MHTFNNGQQQNLINKQGALKVQDIGLVGGTPQVSKNKGNFTNHSNYPHLSNQSNFKMEESKQM